MWKFPKFYSVTKFLPNSLSHSRDIRLVTEWSSGWLLVISNKYILFLARNSTLLPIFVRIHPAVLEIFDWSLSGQATDHWSLRLTHFVLRQKLYPATKFRPNPLSRSRDIRLVTAPFVTVVQMTFLFENWDRHKTFHENGDYPLPILTRW